jgi:hypothetical protein
MRLLHAQNRFLPTEEHDPAVFMLDIVDIGERLRHRVVDFPVHGTARLRFAGLASTGEADLLRLRFSPLDSRVASFGLLVAAAFAVAGRSASWRITTPLPSQERTSRSPGSPAGGCRPV